ncbi:pentapeptide repeat-containing protein [Cyclobacterium xiamenense]|uniref:pentapeptide repeat-containing protein n=1 Tax=Cyclobacterium xiamenense TaxID=1297121 RepID=UPI0035D055C8
MRLKIIYISTSIVGFALIYFLVAHFSDLSYFFAKDNPRGELFRVILSTIGGLGALIALYYVAKQVHAIEKGNIENRFNNAVGHLSNSNSTVVLGGIHVLHQIAIENKSYTRIVHNLFCSYLRENSASLYISPNKCPVVIQTLINYLFLNYNGKNNVYKKYSYDLSFSVLKYLSLPRIEMHKVNFENCVLEDCNFFKGDFSDCDFRDALLKNCRFEEATLATCYFYEGSSTDCNFINAKLYHCSFTGKTAKCNFMNVSFTDCYLGGEFKDCYIACTDIINCGFRGGVFLECDFHGSRINNKCDLNKSTMENCSFKDTRIKTCEFKESLLKSCNFEDSELLVCNFWYATLILCNYKKSKLDECRFWGVNLTNCDFEDTTLTKCDFGTGNNTIPYKAKLTNCNTKNIKLIDTELPV